MHKAEDAAYRVDLTQGKIFWVDQMGLSLVVADCKVLLSYALSNESVLMAWANESLGAGVGVEAVDGFEPLYPNCSEEEVWSLTTEVAQAVNAEALYRAPSPQSWVMLALWNLRPGGPEQFHSGSPQQYVLTVLTKLKAHNAFEELPRLLDNYAQSFLQLADHPHRGSDYEAPLRDTARGMRNLLVYTQEEQLPKLRDGLATLTEAWR